MSEHPELEAEQAHIDHAYRRLDEAREEAIGLQHMVEVGRGGTNQARWEREVINENIANRLRELDLGDRSLVFGRIDQATDAGGGSYHIGRVAVASETMDPLVVDWRAPVAEGFYRATGGDPQGLARRRHFTTRGRTLLGIDDEFFGDAAGQGRVVVDGRELRGEGALIAALEENRTGRLSDIVGTIQAEQDEIIRAPLPGVLVVQGGPGTGKTVVALHRAAYLLYTHRFPLDGQGVMVVGPNRLFLGYIEQVLPSLGEAGIELAVLADLVAGVRVAGTDVGVTSRVKGDLAMVRVVRRAVADRQRPLRSELVVGVGARRVRMTVAQSEGIVAEARRRYRTHNAARKYVVAELFEALAATHPDGMSAETLRDRVERDPVVREAVDWMWPVLTPAQLLHDLYGSRALIRSAGSRLGEEELSALHRPWREDMDATRVTWTVDDVPVLDEARERLGPRPGRKLDDEFRTYGHIVVDEAQDLSPMQLRMLTRRSLNGSMTIVGDIAQSTGAWAHNSWDEVLDHLPDRKPPRFAELTVGYRIPGPSMALAARVLTEAAPELSPPTSVRTDGEPPLILSVDPPGELAVTLVEVVRAELERGEEGNVAVICPRSRYEEVFSWMEGAGLPAGRAPRDGLGRPVTVVPVHLVKGLEVDVAVVVEPGLIYHEEPQGARSLYVATTRATKRLILVNALPLPAVLAQPVAP
ncbi:MAG: HelD family protein [Acidimicrobiales bacterium]